jgi:hypothetical protein
MNRLFHYSESTSVRTLVALLAAFLFVGILPFSGALEVHHIFAAVDHDGHEHSDFDLCQWVQKHTSSSLAIDPPGLAALDRLSVQHHTIPQIPVFTPVISSIGSRAPPVASI